MKGQPSPCHRALVVGVTATVFKKYRTIGDSAASRECPDVGQYPPGLSKRSGWRRPRWRPASHLLSWLYKLEVAQELQVTFQRVDTEAVESVVAFWVHTKTYSLSLTEFTVAGF